MLVQNRQEAEKEELTVPALCPSMAIAGPPFEIFWAEQMQQLLPLRRQNSTGKTWMRQKSGAFGMEAVFHPVPPIGEGRGSCWHCGFGPETYQRVPDARTKARHKACISA